MAKTASKIRKRDLDPQLFMELVSQIDGNINMEELLSNYVKKDDVIGEYQLPPKYRTEVTKELQNLDASVQDIIKKDTAQDKKNADLEHRMQVVENTMHIGVTEDQDVSPIIGTQVAANTTNISRNSAAIKQINAQLTVQADTEMRDKMELQNNIDNMTRDVDDKLKRSDAQVKEVKVLLDGKRNVSDPIGVNDLAPEIKKDMETVISIGEKTASAFTNLDNVMDKIKVCNDKVESYDSRFTNIEEQASSNFSELNQKVMELSQSVESTSTSRVQTINSSMDQIRQEATSQKMNTDARFQTVEETQTLHKNMIDAFEEKIENVAQGNRDNEQLVGTLSQNVGSVKDRMALAEVAIKKAQEDVLQMEKERYLHPNIDIGKTLCVSDIDGTVIGKDMFLGAYFADTGADIVSYQAKSLSPIFSPVDNVMFILKTPEEIAEEAASTVEGEDDSVPEDAADDIPADGTPADVPETDPATDNPPTEPSTDKPAGEVEDDPTKATTDYGKATDENVSPSENVEQDKPTVEGGEVVAGEGEPTGTTPAAEEPSSTDTPAASDDELTEEQKQQIENAKKYKVIENFLQLPENHSVILYDMAAGNVIRGFSDAQGFFHEFTAFAGAHKPIDFEIEAGESYEIHRNNADSRLGLEVRLLDQVKTSQTYNKWINSEGVATVAYGSNTVTVYNSSDKTQKFRILEG